MTIVLALASGAAMPPVGSCMRALWPTLVPGELRVAAFALDAVLQELAFVGGPPLLAAVTALAGPAGGDARRGRAGRRRHRRVRAASARPGRPVAARRRRAALAPGCGG